MYDIYYAHHQWKYGTKIEEHELEVIKRYFPNARICNPSTDLNFDDMSESEAMRLCLDTVGKSDILVFSSVNGCIGVGVKSEVQEAERLGKIVFYLDHDKLEQQFTIMENETEYQSDRINAFVYCY